jgi:hypothetical protein
MGNPDVTRARLIWPLRKPRRRRASDDEDVTCSAEVRSHALVSMHHESPHRVV